RSRQSKRKPEEIKWLIKKREEVRATDAIARGKDGELKYSAAKQCGPAILLFGNWVRVYTRGRTLVWVGTSRCSPRSTESFDTTVSTRNESGVTQRPSSCVVQFESRSPLRGFFFARRKAMMGALVPTKIHRRSKNPCDRR